MKTDNKKPARSKTRLAIQMAVAAIALGTLVLVPISCFSTPAPDCAYLCGDGDGNSRECPEDYFCAEDGACKRIGVAEDFDCGFVAPADASPLVDAAPDAASPDAMPPDAAPPDAAPPDAML